LLQLRRRVLLLLLRTGRRDLVPREDVPLRALPVEEIVGDDALTLKRGVTTVRIDGANAPALVAEVLELAADGTRTEDELVACFPPDAQPSIRALVGELRVRRLLLPVDVAGAANPESPLDVFYWHFGLPDEPSPSPPRNEIVAVGGRNRTARRLGALLDQAGFGEIAVVADPGLDDEADADPVAGGAEDATILAAVSERGFGPLRPWNELALRRELPFLPVAIEDLVAYVGPLVVPYETACFECFLRRRYSNLPESGPREAVELRAGGERVSAMHPAVSAVAAGAAAFELSRFFLPWHPARQAGYLLTFNLPASRSGRHRVLKVPRCPACGGGRTRPPAAAVRTRLGDDAL
jgi:molybdopterin-synthase adenylyltransferase